jgi:filamentous hemagglutinin family protein
MTGIVYVRGNPLRLRRIARAMCTVICTAIGTGTTATILGASSSMAVAAPGGGQIVAGSGSISNLGTNTAIQQNSSRLIINWNSFGTSANESVTFRQPWSGAIALNRVVGQNPSILLGRLYANGQVFIVNPNGVLFGAGSQVNVGGLIASTLSLSNNDFFKRHYAFANAGQAGSVVNQGVIRTAPGGYVALIAPRVNNQGALFSPDGFAALAAGNRVTVTLSDHRMIGLSVDQGVLRALASNSGLIEADGGQAWLAADSEDTLLAGVVNNTGVIRARSAVNHDGVIKLVAEGGTAEVGGTLDASARPGGSGGLIETSGTRVDLAPGANVTTAAPNGSTGNWLIASDNFTVAARGGNANALELSRLLQGTNITIGAVSSGSGTISINQALAWNSPTTLSLLALDGIAVNAPISASAGSLLFGTAGTVTQSAPITAASLALLGPGARFQLDDASNRIGTLAANTGSIVLADSIPLVVGTVGDPTTGITTTGSTTLSAPSITLDAPVTSTATGTAVTLAAASGFVNHAGANAVSTPNGRWLIYSNGPDADTFGGLQSGNLALWGDTFAPAPDSRAAASNGNRFAFTTLQQAVLSANTISKLADTSLPLAAGDVAISLHYVGANYGNAFTDSAIVHEPLNFIVSSNGSGPGAAAGDYVVTVEPAGGWPAGYNVVTQSGTLRVTAASAPSTPNPPGTPSGPTPPTTPETPAGPVTPVPPSPPPPTATVDNPDTSIIDSVQTVAAETLDDDRARSAAALAVVFPPQPPVGQTSGDQATDTSRLPSDAWPGNQCRK